MKLKSRNRLIQKIFNYFSYFSKSENIKYPDEPINVSFSNNRRLNLTYTNNNTHRF
jgi:hypothetical protein